MYKLMKNPFTKQIDSVSKMENNIIVWIPFHPDNTDYQQYLKWVQAGNTPLPADGE